MYNRKVIQYGGFVYVSVYPLLHTGTIQLWGCSIKVTYKNFVTGCNKKFPGHCFGSYAHAFEWAMTALKDLARKENCVDDELWKKFFNENSCTFTTWALVLKI